jgi:type IV secretory pathway component VirB8
MQSQSGPADNESTEIAESVRSGEYFRKARTMYDFLVHDLMTERYLYVGITALSILVFIIAIIALQSLYPLKTPVPFIFNIDNVVDDIPNIKTLMERRKEDPSVSLLRFLVENYVTLREEYSIGQFERDKSGVVSQSSPAVLSDYQQMVDPRNPESPLALYQRVAARKVRIVSSRLLEGGDEMEIVYEAVVEGKGELKKTRWQSNIAFKYSGLKLNDKTGKPDPVSFLITRYRTKRLQEK